MISTVWQRPSRIAATACCTWYSKDDPPTIVPSTDTSQLLALILAKQVLEDATRGQFSKMDPSRASIMLGVTSAPTMAAAG